MFPQCGFNIISDLSEVTRQFFEPLRPSLSESELRRESMHILVWHEGYVPGGGDWSLADLLESWPDNGDQFTVALNDSHPCPEVLDTGYPIVFYRSWRDLTKDHKLDKGNHWFARVKVLLGVLSEVRKIIRATKPHAIILNNGGFPGGSSHYVALICSAAEKVKARIMIVRNFPNPSASKYKLRILGLVISVFATCIVAVSNRLAEALAASAHFFKKRFIVVRNGVREPTARSKQRLREGPVIVISQIGTIEKRKGHDVLLRGVAHLSHMYPQLEVVVTGYPVYPDVDTFRGLAQSLGLQNRVRWQSFNENIDDIFREADLVVMPSVSHESFGRVAVEAMARGIPVIVSDSGGLGEVVQDQVSGLVFPTGDHHALASAIECLVNDEALRMRLKRGGRLAFTDTYNAKRMADEYYSLVHKNWGRDR